MFLVFRREVADVNPSVYLDGAEGLDVGVACKIVSGALAKCAATDKPTYIIRGKAPNGKYQAEPVNPITEYICPVTGSPAVGAVVTLGADAESVTATTTSGVFTVTRIADGMACGYFK